MILRIRRELLRWGDRPLFKVLVVSAFVTIPIYSMGGPSDSVGQWDLPRIILGGLFAITAFFLIRTLNAFDKSITTIFSIIREDEKEKTLMKTDIATLKGRCEAIKCGDKP